VKDGEVYLWGLVRSEDERKALVALAEGVPGVTKVVDETIQLVLSDPDDTHDDRDAQVTTAAAVAVVGIGTALVEAALLPAVVLGAAAVWLPKYFPKAGRTLRPLLKVGALTRSAKTARSDRRTLICRTSYSRSSWTPPCPRWSFSTAD